MLRTVGQFVGKARSMAREFQQHFNEAADEAGLDEVRKGIASVEESARSGDFADPLSAFNDAGKDIKEELDKPVDEVSDADKSAGDVSSTDDVPAHIHEDPAVAASSDGQADESVQMDGAGTEPESDLALDQGISSPEAESDDVVGTADADTAETPVKTVAS